MSTTDRLGHAAILGELALAIAAAQDRQGVVDALGSLLEQHSDLCRLEATLPAPTHGGGWTVLRWSAGSRAITRPSVPPPLARSAAPRMRRCDGAWSAAVPVPLGAQPQGSLSLAFRGRGVAELAGDAELLTAIGRMLGMACQRLQAQPPSAASGGTLDEAIGAAITAALRRSRGKVYGEDGAAAALGLPPSTLQAKMARLGIERGRFV